MKFQPNVKCMEATIVEIKIINLNAISSCAKPRSVSFPNSPLLATGRNVVIAGDHDAVHMAWNSPQNNNRSLKLHPNLQLKRANYKSWDLGKKVLKIPSTLVCRLMSNEFLLSW
ncbi:hypothetical protein CEXT_761811 [Caerostris extrusa]|uniref:Uncharacterized protein n=1 Tax=Caerostris extrusa TaxID=172846 RepID=A0AAV4QK68_CAEEX|nr:hypothetical protein CEXT_761811 [Caerostris extrusa]